MSLQFGEKYNQSIQLNNKELVIPLLGFHNTNAICYFNSLLQCLLSSKNFLRTILFWKPNKLFQDFLTSITENKWDAMFTTKLLAHYNMFKPNQSSSEYFVLLVDILGLDELFETFHKITRICKNCGHKTEKRDKSVNVLVNNVEEFFEYSEDIDNYSCEHCKTKTSILQQRKIEILSPIVVISINKYFNKNLVIFPESFKIYKGTYKLIGTVDHSGGLMGGHYVSRVFRNDKHNLINDLHTSEISSLHPTPENYMLFYERIE